jgi:hypothetical protein
LPTTISASAGHMTRRISPNIRLFPPIPGLKNHE